MKPPKKGKGLRIQTGDLKGRVIPSPVSPEGKSNFTPAIFKKSLFDILESLQLQGRLNLSDSAFLDLFAGSGQIGIEALSRGFAKAVFLELAWDRYESLKGVLSRLDREHLVLRKDAFRFHKDFDLTQTHKVYFIDPPYSFWEKKEPKIKAMVEDIIAEESGAAVIAIQSPTALNWDGFEPRPFGRNVLNVRVLV
ncbi:RNA methyltransferase, RsmD family [Leptospira broomii serovar Hurstbridge str. 5399]|uniref:RNA methyltransferase, RsmD family n=1 Tax=Leptospira broomii serovar Hurstbridge str. 5399 TaxID=1049789 RepID=T0FAX6_9LEPT|nr:RsmD family RNA methyltransferase [Leptospira broomii]EQA45026.1 RNA methyltransferase, RsmD family [Leptospira broomii serovar Hurstbridge str. 5399]